MPAATKKEASHPPYAKMIKEAILALNKDSVNGAKHSRSGCSRQAIVKQVNALYPSLDQARAPRDVKLALTRGVSSGALLQTKGTGGSGSFKLSAKSKEAPKPAAKKAAPKKTISKTVSKTKASPKKKVVKKTASKSAAKKASPKKKASAKK